jgi:hypothetical protein
MTPYKTARWLSPKMTKSQEVLAMFEPWTKDEVQGSSTNENFSCTDGRTADRLSGYGGSVDVLQYLLKGKDRRKGDGSPDHAAMQQANPPS